MNYLVLAVITFIIIVVFVILGILYYRRKKSFTLNTKNNKNISRETLIMGGNGETLITGDNGETLITGVNGETLITGDNDETLINSKCLDEDEMLIKQQAKPKKTFFIDLENSLSDDDFEYEVSDILTTRCDNGYIGWRQYFDIVRVFDKKKADVIIRLTSNDELKDQLGKTEYYPDGTPIKFSITSKFGTSHPEIDINYDNWISGCPQSELTKPQYWEYVINHEFGHAAASLDHELCAGCSKPSDTQVNTTTESSKNSEICPIMYQMTRGIPKGGIASYKVILS